jgi:hypothetical protein
VNDWAIASCDNDLTGYSSGNHTSLLNINFIEAGTDQMFMLLCSSVPKRLGSSYQT